MQNIFQGDMVDALEHCIRKNEVTKFLVVAGKTSFDKCGAKDILDEFDAVEYQVYSKFSANPKIEDVQGGIDALNAFKPDIVLAVGGGLAMDIAKLIVGFAQVEPCDFKDYITSKQTLESIACPLWVAPTTAGSGSEATHFAVVYFEDKKYSVASQVIIPNTVFLDPILTYTAPRDVAVSAGIDVMCQSMESYWAVTATDESRTYAVEAMGLCHSSIIPALEGERKEQRNLQYAGYLAGKAINITKTTAGHAFSYHLTQKYNVTHGHAVAVMLKYVFEYALKHGDKNVLKTCEDMANVLNIKAEELPQFMDEMLEEFELKATVQALGLTTSDALKILCESVNIERLGNTPVSIDLVKFQSIIEV